MIAKMITSRRGEAREQLTTTPHFIGFVCEHEDVADHAPMAGLAAGSSV